MIPRLFSYLIPLCTSILSMTFFWCLKFAYCSSRHILNVRRAVSRWRSIDTHNCVCTEYCIIGKSPRFVALENEAVYHEPCNTCHTKQCALPPTPPIHTRFIGPVASKVKSTITGQTARGWNLYALLIQFPHCQKPGLKAVPPTF